MSQSYPQTGGRGQAGCAGGNCRAFDDVVSRPSLYSTQINNSSTFASATAAVNSGARNACRCGSTCVCGCQQGRPCRCNQLQQQQQQHYRPPGRAAALTAPQPPPIHAATEAFGYGPAVEIPAGGQVPLKQHHFAPTQYAHPMHRQQYGSSSPGGCGSCMEQTQHLAQSAHTGVISVVGRLVCLNCFARRLITGQKTIVCTEQCLREGNPAGVLEYGSNSTIVLLAPSPKFASLHNQTVRVTGIVGGPAVANSGAVLVQSVQVLRQTGDESGGAQWTEHKI